MTKRIKLVAITLSVVIIVALIGSIGATAAIWSSSGTGGNSEVGPSATSENWNVWAKYFKRSSDGVLTGFHFAIETLQEESSAEPVSFNHNRLIIPNRVNGDVTVISGGLFEASVMKEMAEELAIPSTVLEIRASAFSGFVNLKTVTFQLKPIKSDYVIEDFAFAGTTSLEKIYVGTASLSDLTATKDENEYYIYTFTAANEEEFTVKVSPLAFFGSAFTPKTE